MEEGSQLTNSCSHWLTPHGFRRAGQLRNDQNSRSATSGNKFLPEGGQYIIIISFSVTLTGRLSCSATQPTWRL